MLEWAKLKVKRKLLTESRYLWSNKLGEQLKKRLKKKGKCRAKEGS
jgi:hypothetical protein